MELEEVEVAFSLELVVVVVVFNFFVVASLSVSTNCASERFSKKNVCSVLVNYHLST